jgi:hypothetical protein
MRFNAFLSAILLSVMATTAPAATVDAMNESFEVRFTVPVQPADHNGIMISTATTSSSGTILGEVSLFDGDTLLGSHRVTNSISGMFYGSDSMLASGFYGGSLIDYSSISDGTIDGRFTYELISATAGAYITFDPAEFLFVTFGNMGNTGFDGSMVSNTVTTSTTPVPLPASAWLLLAGLGALFGWRRLT